MMEDGDKIDIYWIRLSIFDM